MRCKKVYEYTIKSRIMICTAVFVGLCAVRFTPDDMLTKTKNAVRLVLTQNTDIKKQAENIKNIFARKDDMEAMNPVTEFVNPVPDGAICVGFGVQDAAKQGFHYGVDIKTPQISGVVAAADGKITEIATNDEYGSYVIITHSDEISTLYGGLGEILPDMGEKVSAGKTIARTNHEDNTVHFEIRKGDAYLKPEDFIEFGG